MNNESLRKKLLYISSEFNAKKQTSQGLKFAYFSSGDLKSTVLSLFLKYNIAFSATQKKSKIKKHHLRKNTPEEKLFFSANVVFKYELLDMNTGETLAYKWQGYATDYGDGGRCLSKSVTACFKSWLLTILMISEKTPMDRDNFYASLEAIGIDKTDFKNAMKLLGREKLLQSELEIVFNEINQIRELVKRFTIGTNDPIINQQWLNINKNLNGYKHHQIANYLLKSSGKHKYNWPSGLGDDKIITAEALDEFYLK